MYLLKLSANKPSFREVTFNKTGITIIKGTSLNNDPKKTYNGVGKSLMIRIIDFCLGSNSIKGFNVLKDWEFSLDVELEKKPYKFTRSTENQNKISLNGLEYSLEDFRNFLQSKLFPMEKKRDNLTYRSLISRFLRPKSLSYKSFDSPVDKEEDYAKLLNTCYLLGLDLDLIEKKMLNRKFIVEEGKKYKSIINDSAFIKATRGKGNFETKIINLNTEIESLEDKLKNFKVSDEYVNIRSSKEEVTEQLKKIQNDIFILNKKIQHLNNTLALKADISSEKILEIYNNANILLGDSIKKNIQEVTNFHELMLTQRQNKAKKDLKKYKEQLKAKNDSLEILKKDIDDYGNIFKNTGSFEEYQVLNGDLNKKKIELGNIISLQDMSLTIENRVKEVETNFQRDNTKTDTLLKENKNHIEKIIKEFLNLTKKFYPSAESGIIIENNNGKNKLRYNIDAYIASDSSDGINEVKMFCFDVLLMKLSNHRNNFLIHDNRLLTNIDPRQVVILFKVADEVLNSLEKQYIININENVIIGMKESGAWESIKNLFEGENKKISLELTDENEDSMLLGIKKEVKYDK
jgi:uncharacterized protein YydD (DUF2326 family)